MNETTGTDVFITVCIFAYFYAMTGALAYFLLTLRLDQKYRNNVHRARVRNLLIWPLGLPLWYSQVRKWERERRP